MAAEIFSRPKKSSWQTIWSQIYWIQPEKKSRNYILDLLMMCSIDNHILEIVFFFISHLSVFLSIYICIFLVLILGRNQVHNVFHFRLITHSNYNTLIGIIYPLLSLVEYQYKSFSLIQSHNYLPKRDAVPLCV